MPSVLTSSEKRGLQRRAGVALAPYVVSGVIGFLVHVALSRTTVASASLGLLVAVVIAGVWRITWDEEKQVAPHPRVIRGREVQTIIGLVLVALGYPVGWTLSIAVGAAIVVLTSVGLAVAMGRRHQRLQPTATLFGVLADAFARVSRKSRTLSVAGAAGLAGLLAALGVPLLAVPLGLLTVLAATRLSWGAAKRDGQTRLAVERALAGVLSGGAWDTTHQSAQRIPKQRLDLTVDGLPESIVLPLPERLSPRQRDDAESEIADRLDHWGNYAVRWDTTERTVTITLVPVLPASLPYDGRAADGTKIFIGIGRATKEHEKRGIAKVGEAYPIYWDLNTNPHGVAAGTTGSGKSQTLALIASQALLAGILLCFVDPKRVEGSIYEDRPGVLSITTELEEQVLFLEGLADEQERRYTLMRKYKVNHINKLPLKHRLTDCRRILTIIDETVELLAQPKSKSTDAAKEIAELKGRAAIAIGSLLRLGRAAGLHIILAGQRLDRETLSGENQNNVAFKIIHGVPETIERTMIGLDDTEATPGIPGRAVARTLNDPWTEVQVAYVDLDRDLDKYLPRGGEAPEPLYVTAEVTEPAEEDAATYADVVETTGGSAPVNATKDARANDDQARQPQADNDIHQPRHGGETIPPLPAGEAAKRLEDLIGLKAAKAALHTLESRVLFEKRRSEAGIGDGQVRPGNVILQGPPGVGKTEFAGILASALRDLGVPDFNGHVIKCKPSDLRGAYVGHTGPKVSSACEAARGGMLLLDEADKAVGDDFGKELVSELLPWTDGSVPNLVVALAGYPEGMERLLDLDAGLRSRFTRRIDFERYDIDELLAIAQAIAKKMHFSLDPMAVHALRSVLESKDRTGPEWAEARSVRDLVDDAVNAVSARLRSEEGVVDRAALTTITAADILAPVSTNVDTNEVRETAEERAAKEWLAKHSAKRSA